MITEDLGLLRGANLFHSFGVFNLSSAETARFTGPPGGVPAPEVENILARVTGGSPSSIDGTLHTRDYPGANFFFMNNSGVMFGPNAALEVDGSFHATTADHIRLSDGVLFDASVSLGAESPLSTASPEAFGFVGPSPAPIAVDRSTLTADPDRRLALVGGDIDITDGSLTVDGGRIDVAAVGSPASPGEVALNGAGAAPALPVSGFATLGELALSGADLVASGAGGGTVFIRAGRVVMDGSTVFASINSDAGAGETPGAGVDIRVSTEVVLRNVSRIGTNVVGNVSETSGSGGVRVAAQRLEVRDCAAFCSEIQSVVLPGSSGGSAGDIDIAVDTAVLRDGGQVRTVTLGPGDAGDILVDAGSIRVTSVGPFTAITSFTSGGGSGAAGDIRLTTADLQILSTPGVFTEVSSLSFAFLGAGPAGSISVMPKEGVLDLLISGRGSGIFANSFGTGPGGDAAIGSAAAPATRVRVENRGSIQAKGLFTGRGGDISLTADDVEIASGGKLITNTLGFFGFGPAPAGNINVSARSLSITGLESTADPFGFDATGMFSAALNGAGEIRVAVTDTMILDSRAQLQAGTLGPGKGGLIDVAAGVLHVLGGSNLLNNTSSSGDGGEIRIDAREVLLSGVHPEPFVDPVVGVANLSASGIASQTSGSGDAGTITIEAALLEVREGARITSETFNLGDGGTIDIQADALLIAGASAVREAFDIGEGLDPAQARRNASAAIIANAAPSFGAVVTGDGGLVRIESNLLEVGEGGKILSSTRGNGTAGNVVIHSRTTMLSGDAEIGADSTGTGAAGSVLLSGTDLTLSGGARINASTSGPGAGGNVDIDMLDTVMIRGTASDGTPSGIITESSSALPGAGIAGGIRLGAKDLILDGGQISTRSAVADGGDIKLDVDSIVLLVGGQITTSVGAGEGSGGNIDIDPVFVILLCSLQTGNCSRIEANAFGGAGGNIRIVTDFLFVEKGSVIEASSAKSIDGTIALVTPDTDVSGNLVVLPSNYLDAASKLAQGCAARRGQVPARFVAEGRGGLRLPPDAPLPSHYYVPGDQAPPAGQAVASARPDAVAIPIWLELDCSS